jgi:drug/metabolite transporter (DMT)-like permease
MPTPTGVRQRLPVSRFGYALVAISAACAAANGVVARLVIDAGVSPRELSAVRIYGASLILAVAVLPHLRALHRRDIVQLVPFAVVGFVVGQGLYFQAISRLDIAVVLVVVFTAPLVVAIYQRVFHAERLPLYAYGAMGVAVIGLAMAILGGGGVGELSALGLVLALLTMVAFSASVLMAARPQATLPPLARTGAALLIAALVWLVIVPPWTLPLDLLDETTSFDGRVGFSVPVWAGVAFVVVIGSVAVYACWVAGTSRVGAGAASVVGMAEPMLGAVFAWALLGQSLTALQSLGIATTVAGIAVVEHARIRSSRGNFGDVPVDF